MKFSIVIPTRNRSKTLSVVLLRIAKLLYDSKSFEILVIDNNSTDDTKKVVMDFIYAYPEIRCRYILEKKIGPSFVRNTGIQKSRYPYVVCLDDDVLISKNLLNQYVTVLKKNPRISLVSGMITPVCADKARLSKFTDLLEDNSWVFSDTRRIGLKNGFVNYPDTLISANICINTKQNRNILFDTTFGRKYGKILVFAEDTDLCLQIYKNNKYLIYYDDNIKSKHIISTSRLTFKYILKRFFISGIEQRLLYNKYQNSLGSLLYAPTFRNLLNIFRVFLRNLSLKYLLLLLKEIIFIAGYFYPLKFLNKN